MSTDATGEDRDDASPTAKIDQSMVTDIRVAEFDRRATLVARGATLLTASGTLVALVVGLAVIVTGKGNQFANHTAVITLCKALPWFVLSAMIALAVQTYGWAYQVFDRKSLNKLADPNDTDKVWTRSADQAVRDDVRQQADTICTVRDGNDSMAVWILVGLMFEIVAISLLSVSVGFELWARIVAPA